MVRSLLCLRLALKLKSTRELGLRGFLYGFNQFLATGHALFSMGAGWVLQCDRFSLPLFRQTRRVLLHRSLLNVSYCGLSNLADGMVGADWFCISRNGIGLGKWLTKKSLEHD
jgi:hypothetical protein